jgi:hypothetical protein
LQRRLRDLAIFNLAIDSKLRGCDLIARRAGDVAPTAMQSTETMSARRKQVALFASS